VFRAQTFCRRYRYFCKLDVRAFFDSVDHHTLMALLTRQFRERRLRELLGLIVAQPVPGNPRGKGLPIGNLTSQWFANLYLDGVDHLAKEALQVPGYLRYMDDMVLWSDSKAQLWSFADAVRGYLREQRQLTLKERACVLAPVGEGLPFLGMRIFPGRLRLQRRRWQRSRRLLRRREQVFAAGELSGRALADSVRSICGGLRPFGLRNVLCSEIEL
jgi:hypothetical protein